MLVFFFQAEDGIRDRSPSRGLGDVYKRQYQDSKLMESCVASNIINHVVTQNLLEDRQWAYGRESQQNSF